MDYFKLFDLPEKPVADNTHVVKKYVQLQKAHHPDYYTQETEQEQEEVLRQSAEINKAYKIFSDSDSTLEYFLRQKGVITDDEKYTLPPDFLMEVMELNEAISDGNDDQSRSLIASWDDRLLEEVKDIFERNDAYQYSTEELESLKAYYYKKKYLHRSLDRLMD